MSDQDAVARGRAVLEIYLRQVQAACGEHDGGQPPNLPRGGRVGRR
jgi:hypothetical protein